MGELLDDVIARWRKRAVLPSDEFDALVDELKGQAFRLADVWQQRFLDEIAKSIERGIADGVTVADWRKTAQGILDGFGGSVQLYGGAGDVSPWYAELVLRNANASAFAAGRYAWMFDSKRSREIPFFRYHAIRDSRTRPEHLAMDGMVGRKDDVDWRRKLPPSAHGCRCSISELSAEDVEKGGYQVARGQDVNYEPAEGWNADRPLALVPDLLKRAA